MRVGAVQGSPCAGGVEACILFVLVLELYCNTRNQPPTKGRQRKSLDVKKKYDLAYYGIHLRSMYKTVHEPIEPHRWGSYIDGANMEDIIRSAVFVSALSISISGPLAQQGGWTIAFDMYGGCCFEALSERLKPVISVDIFRQEITAQKVRPSENRRHAIFLRLRLLFKESILRHGGQMRQPHTFNAVPS